MRIPSALVVLCIWLSPVVAAESDAIQPSMLFAEVKATLEKHRYEVDAVKYGLSIESGRKDEILDFCQLDAQATLVIGYSRSTKKVRSLDIWYAPDAPKSQRRNVILKAQRISFEDEKTFTVKVKRQTRAKTVELPKPNANPFD